jgi:Domain of unknown function (DUF4384)
MKVSIVLFGLVCICAVVIGAAPPVPQEQEDVRGAFLTSRPKEKPANTGTPTKPSRRRPKQVVASNDSKTTARNNPSNSTSSSSTKTSTDKTKPNVINTRRIGLGLTLFMRDSNGLAVRTDPAHVFQKGDRVRVLLETNADGYLYIFNTTNDGPPVMIYPDVDLDEAGNYLQAHVPFEIPSSLAGEERLRWLVFDEVAGDERLFFVFTREPLKGIPIEDELIALCRDSKSSCPVRPTDDVWEQVKTQMKVPLQTNRADNYGRAQTASEKQATTRGLGLAKDDPQPSLIMMASSTSSTLVTTLDLVHK